MDEKPYLSRDAKRTRTAYIIQCVVAYMVSLLTTDAFLAKLLKSMGLDDATIGIISSVLCFTFLIELFVIPMMNSFKSRKRVVVITYSLSIVLYFFLYILPFTGLSAKTCAVLSFVWITGASVLKQFSSSMYMGMVFNGVDPKKRGKFESLNNMVSLIASIVLTLTAGRLIDVYESRGDLKPAFLVISIYIFVSAIADLILLLLHKDVCPPKRELRGHKENEFRLLFHNKSYRILLVCQSLQQMALYITIGFLGTYKTGELGFSVWTVQIISSAACILRIIICLPVGSYSDTHSTVSGYLMGLCIFTVSFFCLIFATPQRRWLMIAYIMLYNAALCFNINQTNMIYSFVPARHFSQALSLKNAITGICGFSASLVGGRILSYIQANGNTLFGYQVYAQQVLAAATCVLYAVVILLVVLLLRKRPFVVE